MVLKTIKQSILRSQILCIILGFIVSIAASAVFAEESSYSKEASIEVMPANSTATTNDFRTNLPAPCEELHNASKSEELHAMALEATAKEARSIAEKAKNQDLTMQQTIKALPEYMRTSSRYKSSEKKSSKARRGSKLIWTSAEILLRQLAPREARNRDKDKKTSDQSSASQPQAGIPISREEFAAPLLYKAAQAKKEAEEAEIAAETAKSAAGKARAAADEARLFYEKCIGK